MSKTKNEKRLWMDWEMEWMIKNEKRIRMDWLKHRIKDFENNITDEEIGREELINQYSDKMDEFESNISTLAEQKRKWEDELKELKGVN